MKEIKLPTILKAKIKGTGMSQERFAEDVNFETKSISNWCRGKAYPKLCDVVMLADYFNMTLDELVFGSDEE